MTAIIRPGRIHDLYLVDLGAFSERAFYELHPDAKLLHNWHIDLLCSKLQAFFRGEIRFLIINISPRSLKSHLASIALPTYWLGHRPSAKFICASYGQELSETLSRSRRAVMMSPFYQRTFATRLLRGHQSLGEFSTTRGGYCLATSVGGALTGRGADAILLDDISKPEEALSSSQRKRVIEWYKNTLLSRLDSQVTGQILVIMQRLNQEDITGYLMEQGIFQLVSLPAIAEVNEIHRIVTPLSSYTHIRKEGEALHPAHLPLERLEEIRRTIGTYNFAGQYQQRPAPLGGGIVNIDWFPSYAPGDLPDAFEFVVQSWDCANTVSETASYSVCITFGVTAKRKIYVLHAFRKRLEFPDLECAVIAQAHAHNPHAILIEDKAAGTQLIQKLIRDAGLHTIIGVKPVANKEDRLLAQTPAIQNGQVLIPAEAFWRAELLEELALFPKSGSHDDQVDALSQGLRWISENRHEPGILTYYKEVLRDARAAKEGK